MLWKKKKNVLKKKRFNAHYAMKIKEKIECNIKSERFKYVFN